MHYGFLLLTVGAVIAFGPIEAYSVHGGAPMDLIDALYGIAVLLCIAPAGAIFAFRPEIGVKVVDPNGRR